MVVHHSSQQEPSLVDPAGPSLYHNGRYKNGKHFHRTILSDIRKTSQYGETMTDLDKAASSTKEVSY